MGVVAEYAKKNGAWQEIGQSTPPPPPPETGIIYGSHIGVAPNIPSLITSLNPAVIRTYSDISLSASQSTWSSLKASDVPLTKGASHTFKPKAQDFQTGSANYTSIRNRYRNILAGAPANQLVWVGVWHEPYDNMTDVGSGGKDFTLNEWRNLQINFRADVVDYVNASRGSNPIIFNGCIHGESWGAHQINGNDSVYELYNADVRAALHEFSFDSYNYSYWSNINSWMNTYLGSKKWGVWETGYTLNQTPTDAQVFARMQYWVETVYPSMTIQPSYVSWFNSGDTNGNGITDQTPPNTACVAYWKALCEGSPDPTPANYFA